MDVKLALVAAKKSLLMAAKGVVEPVPPKIGVEFADALVALNRLIRLIDPPVSVTPSLSCPHDPMTCKGCIENACFN